MNGMRSDIHKVIVDVNVDTGVDAILVSAGWPSTLRDGGRPLKFVSIQHGMAWDLAHALLRKWTLDAGPFIDATAHRAASKVEEQHRGSPKSVAIREVACALIREGQMARDKILRRLGRRHMPKYADYSRA